jgi:hypothetical protein
MPSAQIWPSAQVLAVSQPLARATVLSVQGPDPMAYAVGSACFFFQKTFIDMHIFN